MLANKPFPFLLSLNDPQGTCQALKVLVYALASGVATGTDRDRNGLKGPVKSVVMETAAYSDIAGECSEGKRVLVWRARYNTDCSFIESTDYNAVGSVLRRDLYTYDASSGRKTRLSYDSAGLLVEKQTTDLDNTDRVISVENYKKDGTVDAISTWQYNAEGRRVGVEA